MDSQLQSQQDSVLNAIIEALIHPSQTTLAALALVPAAAIIAKAVYNIYFHPLAKFPGPKAYAVSEIYVNWQNYIRGKFHPRLSELHAKHGPIVRIGPDSLSVDGSIAWPQIFTTRPGQPEFEKVPGFFGPANDISLIMAPKESHRRQRRHLGHAFSEAALVEQESYVFKYVNMAMDKFTEHANSGNPTNITDWLNFMAFDIIGDLTFGEPFGSLSMNSYHPWVRATVDSIYGFACMHFVQYHPLFAPLFPFVVGTKFINTVSEVQKFSMEKAKARLAQGEAPGGRRDFITYVSRGKNRDGEVGMTYDEQMIASPLLVSAGSDTTSVALASFFFFIGLEPLARQRLEQEIRGAFADDSEIDFKSVARLQYTHACIEECMRMYPPAVEVPSRLSPGAEVDGKWVPKGTRLTVFQHVMYRNPKHFADPNEFHPERWLQPSHPLYNARYANDNRAVFKPFSAGTRDCIGKNLAYAEMRTFIAKVTLRFDWELVPGQEKWLDNQTISGGWSKGDLFVRFHSRKA